MDTKGTPKISDLKMASIAKFAKRLVLRCVRNTSIECVHEGEPVYSKTGDYSDVKIVTPFGEIPWNEAARITDEEMEKFNKEVLNKLFTVLLYVDRGHDLPSERYTFDLPPNWNDPEIDPHIAKMFDRALKRPSTQP